MHKGTAIKVFWMYACKCTQFAEGLNGDLNEALVDHVKRHDILTRSGP